MNIYRKLYWSVFLAVLTGNPAYADVTTSITSDSTMPGFTTTITPAGSTYTVTGGKTVGTNLFHSFSNFNINSADTATFTAPGINNIISRVTGPGSSSIFGTLNAPANFFLINPNGIMIGSGASINVNGSFHISTADYLKLSDGVQFAATNPGDGSSLTTASPSAFGFNAGTTPGSIQIGDVLIQVPQSEVINVVGGDVEIIDGNLYAPDGQVNVVSVASEGEVDVDPTNMDLSQFSTLGTITISNPSNSYPFVGLGFVGNLDVTTTASADGVGGGRIVIRGGNFYLDNGLVRAEVLENIDGGGIDLKVSGTMSMKNDAKLLTKTQLYAGNAGNVSIEANSLVMEDNATISSDSVSSGNGGVIFINASSVTMKEKAIISADAEFSGDGGSVKLQTSSLDMSGDTRIKADTIDSGQGGNVQVQTDSLIMSDKAKINTSSYRVSASGDAGQVSIQAASINMNNDATINSSTEKGSSGQGGQVSIQTDSITMNDEAWIISYTETDGHAGTVDITADEMTMNDSSVVSTSTFAAGNAGTITINAADLDVNDSAVIISGTEGAGAGGDVIINTTALTVNGNANISAESEGGRFFVRGTPDLSAATGGGTGGDIQITATDRVELKGGSIATETKNADGGNITINAQQLVYLLNSTISTSVSGGAGNGGNISIDPVYVVLNNSQIIANANAGNGGNITIVADNFIKDQASVIEASSNLGIDGTITIDSPNQEVSNGGTELPDSFLSVLELASQECALKTRSDISSLIISGREGLRSSPGDLLPASFGDDSAYAGSGGPVFVMREFHDADNPDLIKKLIVRCDA